MLEMDYFLTIAIVLLGGAFIYFLRGRASRAKAEKLQKETIQNG